MDSVTGAVTFTGTLDREENIIHYLRISAYEIRSTDPTTAISESVSTLVVVTVTDVNDNPPTFFANHYQGTASESSPIGHIAVQGIRAFDIDDGINAEFSFSIMESVPFAIDSATGVITVNEALDYEAITSYSFTVSHLFRAL